MTREERDRLLHDISLCDSVGQLRYTLGLIVCALPVADPAPVGETVAPDGTEWSRKPNVADITEASKYRMINGKIEYWSDLFNGWKTATVYTTPQAIRASNNFNENAPAPTELEAAVGELCKICDRIAEEHFNPDFDDDDRDYLKDAIARVRAAMGRK